MKKELMLEQKMCIRDRNERGEFHISKDLLENRIKDGAGLLNPLSYYLAKVGI